MLHPAFKPFIPQIISLFRQHKIVNACVFGSVLSNQFNKDSDVDILVNMEEGLSPVEAGEHLWNLYDELKSLLNREVDLITEKSLKNPYLIKEINQSKFPIYGY